ncbi:MAG: diguanylate cyclase [Candidatus Omnitrophica bacterium]|nr:diguanylate cyclase [Candidatus Omnitrophota bacterium]
MRCLVLLVIVVGIFIVSVLATVAGGGYSYIFNFSAIPLLVAVFFLKRYEAVIVFGVSAALAGSFFLLGVNADKIIQTLSFLAAVGSFGYYLNLLTRRILGLRQKRLEVIKNESRLAKELDRKARESKLYLEKMVYDISSLYQAPKKMTSSTNLEDLVGCLRSSLEGYFTYKNCKLIILTFKDEEPKVEKVYNIPKRPQEEAFDGYEELLANIMKVQKGPLVVDKASGIPPPEGLELADDVENFVAVALNAGNRFNGVFAAEGVLLDDIIRFTILANQFSMVLERIRLYELVQELAITDGLTGVFVRRYFMERFTGELERARYFNTQVSFLMIDIDNFKRINDKYGHLVGDVVLKEIAQTLKRNLREIDFIGRYGGEEFSVIMPDTAKEAAAVAGERLRSAVEASEIKAYDEKIMLTVSIGVSTFPHDTGDLNQLIDKADQMLYKAKGAGRNGVKVYE